VSLQGCEEDDVVTTEVPKQVRAAAILVAIEALALFVAVVLLVVNSVTGSTGDVAANLPIAAMVAFCGVVLVIGARGLLALRQGARTPVVFLQLLALPVAYEFGFVQNEMAVGLPILAVALATLYLLFTPPARAVLDRHRDKD
jgi:hypothetical protein